MFITQHPLTKNLEHQEKITIYKKFQEEFNIDESEINNAEKLHLDLLSKNPFKYESFYLIAAVCFYAVSQINPKKITLEDIEKVSHIKKEEIEKCYKLILETE